MAFSLKRRGRPLAVAPASVLNPRAVAELYQLGELHGRGIFGQGQRIGFIEFARPSASDDATFWRSHSLNPALNRPVQTVEIDVAPSDPGALGETDLDLQYAGALAPGAELRAYLVSDRGDLPTFLGQVYDALSRAAADGFKIVSISLGAGDRGVGAAGAIRSPATGQAWADVASYCRALDELIARQGLLVFASAGDSGAYGGFGSGDAAVQAVWPASQGAIVAVGGTQLATPGDLASGEQAWGGQTLEPEAPGFNRSNTLPQASGGGGASSFLPAPARQEALGADRRQTPDVAAFSGPLTIVDLGRETAVWGTSASAPITAAVCALVAQSAGRLPTPEQLYAAGSDVAAGNNTNDALMQAGLNVFYEATAGFDLCTGAGVLRAPALLAVL